MITTVTAEHLYEFRGLSSDEKPITWNGINIENGSIFVEMDTLKVYFLQNSSKEQTTPKTLFSFLINLFILIYLL